MIQDIAPHSFKNEYHPVTPDRESYIIYFQEREVLMGENERGIVFPRLKDLEEQHADLYGNCIYLFSIDQERFYLNSNINCTAVRKFSMNNIEKFRTAQPQYLGFAGITAYQLFHWYQSRQFCGRCQHPMQHDEKERMMFCDACGLQEYPKISPAVIVAVTSGNKLLLSKYTGRAFKKYALLAGFTEIGETIEETVKREVMEEVGLQVKNIKYYKSQPWSFSETLLLGFYAELDGEEQITLDREELELAEWFEREEIPDVESGISLTSEMILKFVKGEV